MIENVHQRVLAAAVSQPSALAMDTWHTCDTTHCRAGWIVQLAGAAGRELEKRTSTLFAAMQIYKASSPIRVFPPRFFESNDVALADMRRCAEMELAAAAPSAAPATPGARTGPTTEYSPAVQTRGCVRGICANGRAATRKARPSSSGSSTCFR